MLSAAENWEAEQQEKRSEEMRSGSAPTRQRNPRAASPSSGSDLGQHETVRYVNKKEHPDHPVHDS